MSDTSNYTPNIGGIYHLRFKPEDGIKLKGSDTYRDKFFVVIGMDDAGCVLGYFFINSQINPNLSQDVKDYHFPISPDVYQFLDHDSHIDCSDIKIMTMGRFSDSRNRGQCGQLNDWDRERVLDYAVMSPTSTVKELRRFNLI